MKNYLEWEDSVSESIKGDLLWKMQVYRLGLFASDIGWHDVTKLHKDNRTKNCPISYIVLSVQ